MRDNGYSAGSVLFSFLLGGLVGAGVALLIAPQSGRETRKRLATLSDDAREKVDSYLDETKSKIDSVLDKGKGYYSEKKSLIQSAIDAGKEAYERERESHIKNGDA